MKKLQPFKTSKQMPPILVQHLNVLKLCRRDFDKWWPINLDTPVIGEVRACPNMRGFALATNGIDMLCVTTTGNPFFCHFKNFICDNDEMQGPLNRCLMPFAMWLAANKHHTSKTQALSANATSKGANATDMPVETKKERLLKIYK